MCGYNQKLWHKKSSLTLKYHFEFNAKAVSGKLIFVISSFFFFPPPFFLQSVHCQQRWVNFFVVRVSSFCPMITDYDNPFWSFLAFLNCGSSVFQPLSSLGWHKVSYVASIVFVFSRLKEKWLSWIANIFWFIDTKFTWPFFSSTANICLMWLNADNG